MTPRDLNICFLKAGILAVLVALVVTLRVDANWGTHYAAAAAWGLANWAALSRLLTAVAGWASVKIALLAFLLAFWIPRVGIQLTSFLAGLNTFFIVVVSQALSELILANRPPKRNSAPAAA